MLSALHSNTRWEKAEGRKKHPSDESQPSRNRPVTEHRPLKREISRSDESILNLMTPVSPPKAIMRRSLSTFAELAFHCINQVDKPRDPSPDEPEGTRSHSINFLNTQIFGRHLHNEELFAGYIGSMSQPQLIVVEGPHINGDMHGLLLFYDDSKQCWGSLQIRNPGFFPEYMSEAQMLAYLNSQEASIYCAVSLDEIARECGRLGDPDRLREEMQALCMQHWEYRPTKNNCLSFVLKAFQAYNINTEASLRQAGLEYYQSPKLFADAICANYSSRVTHTDKRNEILPNFLRGYGIRKITNRKYASLSEIAGFRRSASSPVLSRIARQDEGEKVPEKRKVSM